MADYNSLSKTHNNYLYLVPKTPVWMLLTIVDHSSRRCCRGMQSKQVDPVY